MSQTVIGFFDDQSDVQQAIQQLQSRGISRDRIDISRGATAAGSGNRHTASSEVNPVSGSERDENSVRRTSDGRTVDPDGRNTNAITDFFNNLFGKHDDNDDDTGRFRHVANGAAAIVTVHAQSREEAERVADILDDCGAVDVNERASQSGYSSGGRNSTAENTSNDSSYTGSGSSGMRSRIFDRRLEDNQRLRNWDSDDNTGNYNTNPNDSRL